jgi:hypothetical protein
MAAGKFPKDIQILFDRLYKNKDIKTVKPGSRGMRLGYPCLFVYDAKTKADLPYWDSLPFSIVLHKYADGFLGLNLHYLEWTRRIQLAKKLVRKAKNKNRITYLDVKKAWGSLKLPEALLALVIRRYLYSHIRSEIKQFDFETYEEAVKDIRPKFKKQSERRVLAAIRAKWLLHKRSVTAAKKRKKFKTKKIKRNR